MLIPWRVAKNHRHLRNRKSTSPKGHGNEILNEQSASENDFSKVPETGRGIYRMGRSDNYKVGPSQLEVGLSSYK